MSRLNDTFSKKPFYSSDTEEDENAPAYLKMKRFFHVGEDYDKENILKSIDVVSEGREVLSELAQYQAEQYEKGKKCFHFTGAGACPLGGYAEENGNHFYFGLGGASNNKYTWFMLWKPLKRKKKAKRSTHRKSKQK